MADWTEADIPDLTGRTVVVTGANSGLGLRSATVLAEHGARVVLACRSAERGETALASITETGGKADLVLLDLADLASVRAAAERIRELTGDRLDVLMNNAGVMATPKQRTKDGFELQFGSNHLGHAALTWLLMPALRATPASRVVTLSSVVARIGRLNLTDPNYQHRWYESWLAYGQAKLANAVFARELDRRLRAADLDVRSIAAHPGYSRTQLTANMSRSRGGLRGAITERVTDFGNSLIGQDVRVGALPQLFAATSDQAEGGKYYGPRGFQELHGSPRQVAFPRGARDDSLGPRLWDVTAELTGVTPDPA
jgi:NAD(P)-dependent dehydrogenase (short-subunit alcohol dehydrogenase family)